MDPTPTVVSGHLYEDEMSTTDANVVGGESAIVAFGRNSFRLPPTLRNSGRDGGQSATECGRQIERHCATRHLRPRSGAPTRGTRRRRGSASAPPTFGVQHERRSARSRHATERNRKENNACLGTVQVTQAIR